MRDENGKSQPNNPKGGQRKPREIRALVIQIARTTGFGYTRIIGELLKMGIWKISRQTVRNILKEEGIEPGPERNSECWNEFIARHTETLWACDFFSVKTVTKRGLQDMYVLVFLCLETREVMLSPATAHPNSTWVVQQTELFLEQTVGREKKPEIVLHDRDTKFTKEFVTTLRNRGVRTNKLPPASPNLNGRCERVIQTIKLECLARFIIFGTQHLDYLLCEFAEYYNRVRSHTERDHLPPLRETPDEVDSLKPDQIEIKSYVGGLVKSFERKAA